MTCKYIGNKIPSHLMPQFLQTMSDILHREQHIQKVTSSSKVSLSVIMKSQIIVSMSFVNHCSMYMIVTKNTLV